VRLSIQLSRQECAARDRVLSINPDAPVDEEPQALAEALWSDTSFLEMNGVDGIDLEDFEGGYLYTIVGEER